MTTRLRPMVVAGALGVALLFGLWWSLGREPAPVSPSPSAPAAPSHAESGGPEDGATAVVIAASGQVDWVDGAGERRAVVPGAALGAGSLVTGTGSRVRVRLSDGRQFELSPEGEVRLQASAGGLSLRIERGRILARVPEGAGAGTRTRDGSSVVLEISTPFGVTRLGPGESEVGVSIEQDRVRVVVALGNVAFVDSRGKRLELGANQSIEVSVGGVRLIAGGRSPGGSAGGADNPAAEPKAEARPVPSGFTDLMSELGKLRIRSKRGSFRFARRARVEVGTAFQVATRGRARLVGKGLKARLGSRASGRFVAEAPAARRRAALHLEAGSLWALLEAGAVLPLAGSDGARVHLAANETASVRVVGSRTAPTVHVLLGQVTLSRGTESLALPSGQAARVRPGPLRATQSGRPDIALPAIKRLAVHSHGLELAELAWPPNLWSPGLGDVEVKVALDADFEDLLFAGRGHRPYLEVPVPPGRGVLYWRVLARSGGRAATGAARFAPDRGHSLLDLSGPKNLVFESRTMTTVHFQGALPALTFSFDEKPGAVRYRLQVFAAGALDTPLVDRVVKEALCPLRAGDLPEGQYLWQALAMDASGRRLGDGRTNRLEIVYDNALSTLAIRSPKPNQRVAGSKVAVSGVAPVKSRLFVNGKPVPLDDKGRFDLELERAQAFVFRLVEGRGQERFWIRRLRGPS